VAARIFISFAAEDVRYRNFLTAQRRNSQCPFNFEDMSLQEPFDEKWKTQCRAKISSCHGFIVLLSNHTWRAKGARWEIGCAREELGRDKMLGVHIHADDKRAIPPELGSVRVVEWHWDTIQRFIERIQDKRSFWDKLFE
jgi:hypothetical protein